MAIDYKSLEDISLEDIRDYPLVDEGIKNLVRAIRSLGISTHASCEGHMSHGHPNPWINAIIIGDKKFYNMIEEYNKTSNVKWKIDGYFLMTFKKARNEEELKELQKNADNLALFLFNNRTLYYSDIFN